MDLEIPDLLDVIDVPEIEQLRPRRWLAQPLLQAQTHLEMPILRTRRLRDQFRLPFSLVSDITVPGTECQI